MPIPVGDKEHYLFLAVHEYSRKALMLEASESISADVILEYIKKLIIHPEVKKHNEYVLILGENDFLKGQIEDIISPNGKVIFDNARTDKFLVLVIEDIFGGNDPNERDK